MSGGDLYLNILQVVGFLTAIWMAGRVMRQFGASPVVAEIICGVILGPHVLCFVPWAGCEADGTREDGHGFPNAFKVAGDMGVTLMIMQSGMHIDFEKVRIVGLKASIVAMQGTFLPVGMAVVTLALIFGFDAFPDAFSAGMALAPTSVGIALQMLVAAKQLKTDFGQVIITAAFLDDILSLVGLVVLQNLAAGNVTFVGIAWPAVAAFAFVGLGALVAVKWFHKAHVWLISKLPEHSLNRSMQPRDEVQLLIMFITLVVCGLVGMVIGSHLLGAFVAGMLFVYVPRSAIIWERQMKRVNSWLLRLFFASTVAFSVPVNAMLSWSAIGYGLAVTVLACIGPKVLAGWFLGAPRWVVGWAMVPRGEFAYFVAATALKTNLASSDTPRTMMNNEVYAALLWALVLSTLISPFVFDKVLRRFAEGDQRPRSRSLGPGKAFTVRIESHHRKNLLPEIITVLGAMNLDVLEAVVETDGQVDVQVFTVEAGHSQQEVDDEKTRDIRHSLLDAVNDPDAQVVLTPCEPTNNQMLEIQVTCHHHPQLLAQVTKVLQELSLEVYRCQVNDYDDTDVDLFYATNSDESRDHIDHETRATLRDRLKALLREAHVKGEVLVKAPKYSQMPAHMQQYQPSVTDGELVKVTIQAESHHPTILTEVSALLFSLRLDVIHAELEAEYELAVFFVKPLDSTGEANLKSANGIKAKVLAAIPEADRGDCHVRVERATHGMLPSQAPGSPFSTTSTTQSPMLNGTPGAGAGAGMGQIRLTRPAVYQTRPNNGYGDAGLAPNLGASGYTGSVGTGSVGTGSIGSRSTRSRSYSGSSHSTTSSVLTTPSQMNVLADGTPDLGYQQGQEQAQGQDHHEQPSNNILGSLTADNEEAAAAAAAEPAAADDEVHVTVAEEEGQA